MAMRFALVGSVGTSRTALEALLRAGADVVWVGGLDRAAAGAVSGYAPLHEIARARGIPADAFARVNDPAVVSRVRAARPDVLFVVGLSQLIGPELLAAAPTAIGFHPTALPKHRGRAAVPWMILLGVRASAVSLFRLDAGMDSGDLLLQRPYAIGPDDYADDVHRHIERALADALRDAVPLLQGGGARFTPQNPDDATWLLARRPDDGRIDWSRPADEIRTLIRASAPPYPGAFALCGDRRVVIERAHVTAGARHVGFPGQVVDAADDGFRVVVGGDYLHVTRYAAPDGPPALRPGARLR